MSGPVHVTADLLRDWALPDPGSDKGSRGCALVVGGSGSTPGAVILAGEAALRAGGGKLQVATVRSVAAQVSLALPEALVRGFAESASADLDRSASADLLEMGQDAAVTLLGPGLLDPDEAAGLLAEVVPGLTCSVVVDALGSAYVTHHPEGLHHLEGKAVLTVNPDELAHTLGVDGDDVDDDPAGAASDLAERARCVVLCGGPTKVVASPGGEVHLVHEGGPGLGVSGSGDVQAGLVTGLLARGAGPTQAAVWGAFLHGAAGDRMAESTGRLGFLAREVPDEVPRLLTWLGA